MSIERFDTAHKKLTAALLVTIAMVTAVFGFVLVYKRIFDPLRPTSNFTFQDEDQAEAQRVAALKNADTDHDGVSDYDELYVFRTSPYREDTDSDGIDDGAEIAANQDPNCPRGQECRQTVTATPSTGGTSQADSGAVGGATGGSAAASGSGTSSAQQALDAITEAFGDPTKLTEATIRAKIDAMSSAELHDFLGRMGVPESALANRSDDTLKQLLADTLVEISGAAKPVTP